jgi:hypothetical protein
MRDAKSSDLCVRQAFEGCPEKLALIYSSQVQGLGETVYKRLTVRYRFQFVFSPAEGRRVPILFE